jgi:hypothetical protein
MSLDAVRAQARSEGVGRYYSGVLHFAFTNCVGLGIIIAAATQLQRPRWSLLAVPLTFLYANLIEYLGHKGPMHRPVRLLGLVYRRHTLLHHAFFTHGAMEVESARDFKMVLFPPVLILFFFGLFAVPMALVLRALLGANVAALFVITAMAYFLLYEWLHLAYHLGDRFPLVRGLRRHHAAHNDPRAMSSHNFNITFPICDAIFGTRL